MVFAMLVRVGAIVCEPVSQDVCFHLSILSVINTVRLKCGCKQDGSTRPWNARRFTAAFICLSEGLRK